ncbi:MAG: NADP-dependent malic enzyme [Acidobacteria bacterium]|nr:NADP-dependent malic enzyme [Acidobacteriota bacterium]
MTLSRRELEALEYHSKGRPGKVEVISTKPCLTQRDLSLAYTPGVAVPCLHIAERPEDAFRYTSKGNLVAVVSNGTAVLGLGNIGALASKPVMEGKGVLFKRFGNIDVFDIEVDSKDPDEIVRTVKLLEPTFGGINLEDIKAPECFYIEEKLIELMNIPVFHDDQHGTAIIAGAALINACEITERDLSQVRLIICGAGAAGIACAKIFTDLGIKKENVMMVDTRGVIYTGRTDGMNPYKERWAVDTDRRTLAEAMDGADAFVGLSAKDMVSQDMVRSMNKNPIIFAMANPDPEITYEDARAARPDVIMATGRSDYPNQVNNVLGFPFIFRGALDVRATAINNEMKLAASHALATLAKQDVPDGVIKAYGGIKLHFGPEYIIPKPFDPRVLLWEAPAVAQAAIDTGVAQKPFDDIEAYRQKLESMLGLSKRMTRLVINKVKHLKKKIVFPEGEEDKVLRAAQIIVDEDICTPVLLGNSVVIRNKIQQLGLDLKDYETVDPLMDDRTPTYAQKLYEKRRYKGMTPHLAGRLMQDPVYFGMMMVEMEDADGLVSGITSSYPETIRPALQVVGLKEGARRVAGLYMMIMKDRVIFLADTTVNLKPTADELAEIAIMSADAARYFDYEPKVAFISYTNFGSVMNAEIETIQEAVRIARKRRPDIVFEGDMQADTALVPEFTQDNFPHSQIQGDANVLIFPELFSANAAYKLVQHLGKADAVGPMLLGMRKPINLLTYNFTVDDIVTMTSITVMEADKL